MTVLGEILTLRTVPTAISKHRLPPSSEQQKLDAGPVTKYHLSTLSFLSDCVSVFFAGA
jgi:hypothetical protein